MLLPTRAESGPAGDIVVVRIGGQIDMLAPLILRTGLPWPREHDRAR